MYHSIEVVFNLILNVSLCKVWSLVKFNCHVIHVVVYFFLQTITLDFKEFILEDGHDTLQISDPSAGGGIDIVYTGTKPAFTVGPEYTSIALLFTTNRNTSLRGFTLDFYQANSKWKKIEMVKMWQWCFESKVI